MMRWQSFCQIVSLVIDISLSTFRGTIGRNQAVPSTVFSSARGNAPTLPIFEHGGSVRCGGWYQIPPQQLLAMRAIAGN
jgi:hypothetical protein